MSNQYFNKKLKDAAQQLNSYRKHINDELANESSRPDHELSPDSLEKKKRDTNRYMHFLIENLKIDFQIALLIDQAFSKYQEDEVFYKNLHQVDEVAIFFKHLNEVYLENQKFIMRLTNTQEDKLKTFQHKIEHAFNLIKMQMDELTIKIIKLKSQVEEMKKDLNKISDEYYDLLRQCFLRDANYTFKQLALNISPLIFDAERNNSDEWNGIIEITEKDFRNIGNAIVHAMQSQHLSIQSIDEIIAKEAGNYIKNEFLKNISNLSPVEQCNKILELEQTYEYQSVLETLVNQIHDHIHAQDVFNQLQVKMLEFTTLQNSILEKEDTIQTHEQQLEILSKSKEALESAADTTLSILEKSTCDHSVFDQLTKSGDLLIEDILNKCALPIEGIKLDVDISEEKTNISSPRLR